MNDSLRLTKDFPRSSELPLPLSGKTGWPWTEESDLLPDTMPDGSMWPRVSVVTPSYNQEQFIEETIRSVLLQGYPNLEYIVIDGGSSDGSVNVIKKYEPWISYWVSEPDAGQAAAVNKGWEKSSGQLLGWINSDDVLKPNALASIVSAFAENPGNVMIYGDNELIDESGNVTGMRYGAPVDYLKMLRTLRITVPQPGSFVSRGVLDAAGYLNEEYQVVLDRDFFVRCGLHCDFVYIPATLAQFRLHSTSKSVAQSSQWANELPPMYERFFDENSSANEVRELRDVTVGRAYHWAARIAARGNLPAFGYLKKAIRIRPLLLLHPGSWIALGQMMLQKVSGR